VSYDPATRTATFTFGVLPDGNYRTTLTSAGVTNPAGIPMAADYTLEFFVLAGDANRDRIVDFADLVALAQNYNVPDGKTWADGDFTGDGAVDFNDLVILAQRYNTTLPPPPAQVVAAGAVAPSVVRDAPATRIFSTARVTKPTPAKPRSPARPRRR
jgi:hypothetical protein